MMSMTIFKQFIAGVYFPKQKCVYFLYFWYLARLSCIDIFIDTWAWCEGRIERRWDIFGQLASSTKCGYRSSCLKDLPRQKDWKSIQSSGRKRKSLAKLYSAQNRGWWGSDGVIQPNSCFGIFHPPRGLASFFLSSISINKEHYTAV